MKSDSYATNSDLSRRSAVKLLAAGVSSLPSSGAESVYTLKPVQYGSQLRTPDGREVFTYLTAKPENIGLTSPSAACFHPVNTPSGHCVTAMAPDDHPHHRGMFFGFMNIEFRAPNDYSKAPPTHPVRGFTVRRGDFWAWGEYAPREGRIIQNRNITLVASDSRQAQIAIQNEWIVTGHKMMNEVNQVFVAERDGLYVIDLYYQFAPLVECLLLQTAFGGFAVQCQKYGESYYATASGKVTLPDPHYSYPDSDLPSEPWYDFTIQLKSNGKVLGTAVLDHPLNPPTLWHNARYLWMLNPCITAIGPITIQPKTPLLLRYRVVVHDGPTPTDALQKLSQEWRSKINNPVDRLPA